MFHFSFYNQNVTKGTRFVCTSSPVPERHTLIFSGHITMTKFRGFSIVLHDVQKGLQTKSEVEAKIKTLKWRQYVIAEEPYNHQEGSHIHVFLQLHNPVYFTAMLKLWCVWWKSGRVQVDQMRGSMAQACIYVTPDSKKEKHLDSEPIIMLGGEDAAAAHQDSKVELFPSCPHEKGKGWKSDFPICVQCFTPIMADRILKFIFPGGTFDCTQMNLKGPIGLQAFYQKAGL